MAESLLAHLYTNIRGSQEDVATISLQYILSQSSVLNKAFSQLCFSTLKIDEQESLQYICQSVGENNERPDMVGVNQSGTECILCEMKFYASLTANQPLAYLDRLNKEKPNGLLFICPKSRLTPLWATVCQRCLDDDRKVIYIDKYCATVNGIPMAILTWSDILNCLSEVANKSATAYLSDIHQLTGYCNQMDKAAFMPFSKEELTAENAIKIQRYHDVIDETTNLILADKNIVASQKGKATPYYAGYERKLYIDDFIIYIEYDRNLWKSNSSVETPFWVSICDKNNEQPETFRKHLLKIDENKQDNTVWNIVFLALNVLTDATLSEVCENMKEQILEYIDLFR